MNETLLDVLACPVCHGSLRREGELLICASCKVGYPVRDGIPVMLPEAARPVTPQNTSSEIH